MKKNNKQKVYYDKKSDILWFLIKSGPEERYEELSPDIGLEFGKNDELLGIEIFNASKVLGSKMGLKPQFSHAVTHKVNKKP